MTQFAVTLKALRQEGACFSGYNKVVRALQGLPFTREDDQRDTYIHFAHEEAVPLSSILESNGLDDALWSLRCLKDLDRDLRSFAVWCARQVEHLMEDQRSKDALDVAERYSNGEATEEELEAACDAAWTAAWDAASAAASAAACDAASAAACDAAYDAARTAACDAARIAAWDAARTAARDAARDAARGAEWGAAWGAARAVQKEMFLKMCNGEAPWQDSGALVRRNKA